MKQLVINPGSTSTKIAVFDGLDIIFEKTLRHSVEELGGFKKVIDQLEFRKDIIMEALKDNCIEVKNLSAIVGRGGLLRPMTGGTYRVNEAMLEDLKSDARGEHASNLGGVLAYEIAGEENIPSFIVDPIVVDELEPLARLSGHPEFERKSIFHALNQKAVGRRAAEELGSNYEEVNLVVAHLGGGVSIGAHKDGRIIDVNNALDGEGPYSPERSGSLPSGGLVKMSFSGDKSLDEMKKMIKGAGGLMAYLATNDARAISQMCSHGDEEARLVYEGMAYQVAKAIGSYAVVLEGEVDAIVITGGIAYDKDFVSWIRKRVGFIADIIVYPGEDELDALAQGGLRVLKGQEEAKEY